MGDAASVIATQFKPGADARAASRRDTGLLGILGQPVAGNGSDFAAVLAAMSASPTATDPTATGKDIEDPSAQSGPLDAVPIATDTVATPAMPLGEPLAPLALLAPLAADQAGDPDAAASQAAASAQAPALAGKVPPADGRSAALNENAGQITGPVPGASDPVPVQSAGMGSAAALAAPVPPRTVADAAAQLASAADRQAQAMSMAQSASHTAGGPADAAAPPAAQPLQSAGTDTDQALAAGHPAGNSDADPARRPRSAGNVSLPPQTAARDVALRPLADDDSELARLLTRQEPDRQPVPSRLSHASAPATPAASPEMRQPDAAQPAIRVPAEMLAAMATAAPADDAKADPTTSRLSTLHAYGGEVSLVPGRDGTHLETTLRHLGAVAARPDVQAVALRIAQKSADGANRFEIELDPPELGRVEVRLEFGRDGQVRTHMLVDRPDTLDALLRDSRGLERALNASGLKLEGGIQYELRDQSSFAQSHGGRDQQSTGAAPAEASPDATADPTNPAPLPQRLSYAGGLDLRI